MTNINEKKAPRITKTMRFDDILAMLNGEAAPNGSSFEEVISFIHNEKDLLSRKNKSGGEKKLTPIQKENEGHKNLILEFLGTLSEGMTASDILKAIPEFDGFSNQKVSSLLRQLKNAGVVTSEKVKGKTLFSLVHEDEMTE